MSLRTGAVLVLVVGCLSVGQVLFKLAGDAWRESHSLWGNAAAWLVPAMVIYAVATVGWVWVLGRVALNVAYPYMGLAFVVVPVLAMLWLGEKVSMGYWAGAGLIVAGVAITSGWR